MNDTANQHALEKLAADTFLTEDEAFRWLRRPHPILDGKTPLQAAHTHAGLQRVKDILIAIQHGGVV